MQFQKGSFIGFFHIKSCENTSLWACSKETTEP